MTTARRAISGVLLLDKPVGLSSNTALGRAKWLLQALKAGHTGTLDPFATGLLPLCFGEATKFARFMLDADKRYIATLKLGETTTTGDTEGSIVTRRDVTVSPQHVADLLPTFLGERQQMPPMHSAIKQGGVPLYKLARQGIEVERATRDIHISALTLVSLVGDELILDAAVSKGTYVRVLAEEIGEALGCGAHLIALRRTQSGGFSIADSVTIDRLEVMTMAEREAALLSPDRLCLAIPELRLAAREATAFGHGQVVATSAKPGEFRIYDPDDRFLGIGTANVGALTPVRLMSHDADTVPRDEVFVAPQQG